MAQPFSVYSLLSVVLGVLYLVYPEKAAWLRHALKQGTTENVSPPESTVKLMRAIGFIVVSVGVTLFLAGVYG